MAQGLLAGAARADITPHDLTGLNPFGPSFERVHDPIHARAVVVSDGHVVAAIVALDLVEVGDTSELRARIERELGIVASRVLIAPSHDHNAPRIGLVPPGGKARVPTPESLRYTGVVDEAIVSVLRRAREAMVPARIGAGDVDVDVNVNREVRLPDGRWGLGHDAEGRSDKGLRVVSLVDTAGMPIAVLLNYAVHSTVALGVPELSGDLAGAAAREVEARIGGGVVALWLSGALGDQAPKVELGASTGDPVRNADLAFTAVATQGRTIAAAAVRAAAGIKRFTGRAVVAGGLRVIECPARRLEVPPGMEQADVDTVALTLTCVAIGSIAFAGVSGEVTVPVARAVRRASPLRQLLLVSNANARIGYLPDDESYDRWTQAAEGCPIVQGHAQAAIVGGLAELLDEALGL